MNLMKKITPPPPYTILKVIFFVLMFQNTNNAFSQEFDTCGSIPIEKSFLYDRFYNQSEELINILNQNGFEIPRDYLVNINLTTQLPYNISIYNMYGKEVLNIPSVNTTKQLNVAEWDKGIYFFNFKRENHIFTKKLIIK